MPINFQQTDTAPACTAAAFCSGRSLGGADETEMQAEDGGTAGITADTFGMAGSDSLVVVFTNEIVVAAGVTWAAGTWTVRVDITKALTDFTFEEVHLCRVNSSCVSQASFGSLTAIGESVTAGVHTFSVTGTAETPSAGDIVQIVHVMSHAGTMTKTAKYVPSQLVDSPFTAPVGGIDELGAMSFRLAGNIMNIRAGSVNR